MACWHLVSDLRRRSCCLGALARRPRARRRPDTAPITGKVTDQAGGAPLEAARVVLTGTNRIETTNREGQLPLPRRGAGHLPGPRAPGGLSSRPPTPPPWPPGETVTLDFAMDAGAGAARRDRHHRHRRAAQARDGNAVTTIDAAKVAEQAPITEFANLISGRAAGRPGAQEQRHDRHRHPDPDPRLQQHLALQRAALLPRRHPAGERLVLDHARHRRLRRGRSARAPRASTTSTPTTSSHRDREGPGGGHALRHPGVERRRPDHHQARHAPARRGGTSSPRSGAVTTTTPTRSTIYGRDTTAATGPDFDGFCTIQSELDGRLHPDLGAEYSPLNNTATRPLKAGLRQQYGANVSGGSDQVTYFVSRRLRERGRRLPAAADRGGLGPRRARHRAGQSDPAQRAREVQRPRQRQRQRLARRSTSTPRSASSPAIPGSSRTTTAS